ncbi:hypothetical protein KQJ29_36895, partial [Enterococcus sp. S181_ASV_20]|nr:hypothetical protein [Enterococcus sp. S181_ASV_20]
DRLWPKEKFTHLQKQFCSFDKDKGLHLWLIEEQGIRLLYHIHEIDGFVYCEEHWPANSKPLKEIFHSSVNKRPPQLVPTIE